MTGRNPKLKKTLLRYKKQNPSSRINVDKAAANPRLMYFEEADCYIKANFRAASQKQQINIVLSDAHIAALEALMRAKNLDAGFLLESIIEDGIKAEYEHLLRGD